MKLKEVEFEGYHRHKETRPVYVITHSTGEYVRQWLIFNWASLDEENSDDDNNLDYAAFSGLWLDSSTVSSKINETLLEDDAGDCPHRIPQLDKDNFWMTLADGVGRAPAEESDEWYATIHESNIWWEGPSNTDNCPQEFPEPSWISLGGRLHRLVKDDASSFGEPRTTSIFTAGRAFHLTIPKKCPLPAFKVLSAAGCEESSKLYSTTLMERSSSEKSSRLLNDDTAMVQRKKQQHWRTFARICVAYIKLFMNSPLKTMTNQDLITFPFLSYAARAWPLILPHMAIQDALADLELLLDSKLRQHWLLVHQPDKPWVHAFEDNDGVVAGTPLYYASYLGSVSAARWLVEHSGDLNSVGGYYSTPLIAASSTGNTEIVQLLLQAGADIGATDNEHGQALHIACFYNYIDVIRVLLESQADVNAIGGTYGYAVQAAASKGNADVVKLLIEHGASVNSHGGHYGTALHAACANYYTDVAELLLLYKVDINTPWRENLDNTVLHEACIEGDVELAQWLIDRGAAVHAKNAQGDTALSIAIFAEYPDLVNLLTDKEEHECAKFSSMGCSAVYKVQINARANRRVHCHNFSHFTRRVSVYGAHGTIVDSIEQWTLLHRSGSLWPKTDDESQPYHCET